MSGMVARLLRLGLRQLALLTVVALAVFSLLKLSPIDPVQAYLGPAMSHISPAQKVQIEAAWGLNQPLASQFLAWGSQLLQGNLGHSTSLNMPVATVLAERLGASVVLTGSAWLLSGIFGFALGSIAAFWRGRALDRAIRFYCYLLAATPSFWLAMVLLMGLSVGLGWTPICCAGPVGVLPDQVTWGQRLHHLILPLATLSLFGVAQIALHTRIKMIEVLQSDYVVLARSQGAGGWDIALRHGLRNAGLPALTALFACMSEILGGAILAEQVFAWPGLGRATVEAGIKGDVALLLAIALLTGAVVALGNLIADALAPWLQPASGVQG